VSGVELVSLIGVGVVVGILGGLLGIGGSIIMIPVLTLVFREDQHLSQAAAMIVNVFVSMPALWRHSRAKKVDWTLVRRMIPAGLLFIVVGVEVSNYLDGKHLERIFGVFLVYVVVVNLRKILFHKTGDQNRMGVTTWPRASFVGVCMGLSAGLLGIGGGIIAVPLMQRVCRMPLTKCIACSAAVMCVTSPLGALRKNMELADVVEQAAGEPHPVVMSLMIAACLIPTAIAGSLLGATMTHRLPLKMVRAALVVLMSVAAAKFLGVV
jgi:uncharacterized membrane protein YfcA